MKKRVSESLRIKIKLGYMAEHRKVSFVLSPSMESTEDDGVD
jgi:hypothetical protein